MLEQVDCSFVVLSSSSLFAKMVEFRDVFVNFIVLHNAIQELLSGALLFGSVGECLAETIFEVLPDTFIGIIDVVRSWHGKLLHFVDNPFHPIFHQFALEISHSKCYPLSRVFHAADSFIGHFIDFELPQEEVTLGVIPPEVFGGTAPHAVGSRWWSGHSRWSSRWQGRGSTATSTATSAATSMRVHWDIGRIDSGGGSYHC